jgi:hypothetical protein
MIDWLATFTSAGTGAASMIALAVWRQDWIGAQLARAFSHRFDVRLAAVQAELKQAGEGRLAQLQAQLRQDSDTALEQLRASLRRNADRELEEHRARLRREADGELEQLRSALARELAQQNAVFAQLIVHRFNAIKAVHAPLVRFHHAVARLVQPVQLAGGPSHAELMDAASDACQALDEQYDAQRIFLTYSTARRTGLIRDRLVGLTNRFHVAVGTGDQANRTQEWIDAHQAVSGEVYREIAALEAELRTLMGDRGDDGATVDSTEAARA